MELIKAYCNITNINLDALTSIEKAGRVCYKSEDKITENSSLKFIETIMKLGHESVIEHASATVRFVCDRGVSHEIVRHRIASYSQESTRYCNYGKTGVKFIIPSWCNDIEEGMFEMFSKFPEILAEKQWLSAMLDSESRYNTLLNLQWTPQQARSVLPNSLKTEIVMTANFREWRHFLKLRTAKAAHPDMRYLAIPLLYDFKQAIPIIFDDINC